MLLPRDPWIRASWYALIPGSGEPWEPLSGSMCRTLTIRGSTSRRIRSPSPAPARESLRTRRSTMQRKAANSKEKGQSTILILVALSLFLLAGMGLTLDVSQLYAQRQLAQNAADAAALAAMMTIFNGTNTPNATFDNTYGKIPTGGGNPARLPCGSNDNHTPCYYARLNGFDPARLGERRVAPAVLSRW